MIQQQAVHSKVTAFRHSKLAAVYTNIEMYS